jgi:hypothetical protein
MAVRGYCGSNLRLLWQEPVESKGSRPNVRIQSNLRFVKSDVVKWVAEHSSEIQNPKRK